MLILEELRERCANVLGDSRDPSFAMVPYGGQAERGCRPNEVIITYLGNLSIVTYKWFVCCGIAAGKAETRNVNVETGRQKKSNPAPFAKPSPKGCATRRPQGKTSRLSLASVPSFRGAPDQPEAAKVYRDWHLSGNATSMIGRASEERRCKFSGSSPHVLASQ